MCTNKAQNIPGCGLFCGSLWNKEAANREIMPMNFELVPVFTKAWNGKQINNNFILGIYNKIQFTGKDSCARSSGSKRRRGGYKPASD